MLTIKQRDLLQFVASFMKANGDVSPSIRQIADGIGSRTTGGVHRTLCSLEERGFIERVPGRARSIRVLYLPGERGAIDDFVRSVKELERKAGPRLAIAMMADLANEMLARHEATILVTTNAVGNA